MFVPGATRPLTTTDDAEQEAEVAVAPAEVPTLGAQPLRFRRPRRQDEHEREGNENDTHQERCKASHDAHSMSARSRAPASAASHPK